MKITRLQKMNSGTDFIVYVGDAVSTRGTRYKCFTQEEGETDTAMRQEIQGLLQTARLVTAPPALRSAMRSAVLSAGEYPDHAPELP